MSSPQKKCFRFCDFVVVADTGVLEAFFFSNIVIYFYITSSCDIPLIPFIHTTALHYTATFENVIIMR